MTSEHWTRLAALVRPWLNLHHAPLLVMISHPLTFPHWRGSGRAFVFILPPPSASSSALVKLWLSLRNGILPLRPHYVHVSLSVAVRPRSSLAMTSTGSGPGPGPGLKQPIKGQCMMRKKTTVPIWFEPKFDSPLPVSPTLSHIRQDRRVGACGAVYCLERCTCMSDLRSQKRPILMLCMMYPNAMVPIQFEPKLEGHQPVPHTSHPFRDRYTGPCGAVYSPQALYLHARCSIVVKSRCSVLPVPFGCWRAGCCLR
jgi:hypothetical protein